MKIGFIGFGNMANAIAGGINAKGEINPNEIGVFDINPEAKENAKKLGFVVFDSEKELCKVSEYIFLCVKPQTFTELLPLIKGEITKDKKVLSIAAGITISSITNELGSIPVIRAMPNTPLLLGCGTVALTCNELTNSADYNFIKEVFESVGTVYNLPEDKFNEVIIVNGSTPAFIYLFAKTIAEYANAHGIDYETALPMFCDTMHGAANMLTKSGFSADELITMVSSKGGTTVAALETFEKTGFTQSLQAGLDACVKRAYELSL